MSDHAPQVPCPGGPGAEAPAVGVTEARGESPPAIAPCGRTGETSALRPGVEASVPAGPDGGRAQAETLAVVEDRTVPLTGPITSSDAQTDRVAPEPDLHLGSEFGDYGQLEPLAHGGMGVVYRAVHNKLHRPVALKLIRAGQFAGELEVRRFYTEAEAAARLDHPNIVHLYEVGQCRGLHFLAMRLIQGQSLRHHIPRLHGDTRATIELMIKVARAVHYAHQRGILHRDLKPDNVLIDESGEPHVTDFGLAKLIDADTGMTMSGAVMGTPAFMAPEQAAGRSHEITTAVDVYALGAVLYNLLTERQVFEADSTVALLRKVVDETPASPRSVTPGVDRDIETICLKCLAKEPGRRYESAEALAADLERWARREPILAQPVSAPERVWLWCRRRPVLAGLVAALVLSVVLGFAGVTWQWHRAEVARQAEAHHRQVAESARTAAETARDEAEAALKRERYENYRNAIALASSQIADGVSDRAEALLWGTPPELRHWEWGRLLFLCHQELMALSGKDMTCVTAVAFSPDGRRVLIAGGVPVPGQPTQNRIRIVDAATGARLVELMPPAGYNSTGTAAFSADGTQVVNWGRDGLLCLYDATTGKSIRTFPGHKGRVWSAAISPDGRCLASGGEDKTARLWDAATGRELVHLAADHQVVAVAFSPDGQRLATAEHEGPARIRDAATGAERVHLDVTCTVLASIAFSPDGTQLALIPLADGAKHVALWNTVTGQKQVEFTGHTNAVTAPAFSPDGRRVASVGMDRVVRVWDSATGQELSALTGHAAHIRSVAFSPDGRRLVSGSYDGDVRIWDATGTAGTAALVTDGLASMALAFSPDGTRLVSSSGCYDLASGRRLYTLPVPAREPSLIWGVAFAPDGTRLATAGADRTICLRDAATGRILSTLSGHTDTVWPLAFTLDGTQLLSGSLDHTLRRWDPLTGRPLSVLDAAYPEAPIRSIAVSPVGHRAAIAWGGPNLGLLDTATGADDRREVSPASGEIVAFAFSPDGTLLAGGWTGGAISVWTTSNWHHRLIDRGHGDWVTALAFSPDGRRLWSGSRDQTLKLWDTASFREILTIPHPAHVVAVAVSPDGQTVALGKVLTLLRSVDWHATPESIDRWQQDRYKRFLAPASP